MAQLFIYLLVLFFVSIPADPNRVPHDLPESLDLIGSARKELIVKKYSSYHNCNCFSNYIDIECSIVE